jgi:hypothetical protein
MNEFLIMSPRSGRMKIAQRFIAGIGSVRFIVAREAGDRLLLKARHRYHCFQSPVSRAWLAFCTDPALKVLGYYRSSAKRTTRQAIS